MSSMIFGTCNLKSLASFQDVPSSKIWAPGQHGGPSIGRPLAVLNPSRLASDWIIPILGYVSQFKHVITIFRPQNGSSSNCSAVSVLRDRNEARG